MGPPPEFSIWPFFLAIFIAGLLAWPLASWAWSVLKPILHEVTK